MASNIWKLGCNWGSGKPSFYEYIKRKNIVIGAESQKYNVGDLIAIAEGHQVKAIAKVQESPKLVTSNDSLEIEFEPFKIDFEDYVNYANADWYELKPNENFSYKLQQGICRVQNNDIRNKVLDLWNTNKGDKSIVKPNYKEQYTTWLNSTNEEGSNKAVSYINAIEYLSKIQQTDLFEEDNFSKLNELYNDLLKEQKNQVEGGKYFYPEAPSYGKNGFYSAAINSYSDFIAQLQLNLPKAQVSKPKTQKNMPLNTILFGPPGTGKTYNTINKSVAIANPTFDLAQDRDLVKKEFDRLMDSGQIVFTTFHQSMSYEDFIEGIKPDLNEEDNVIYDIEHGIFRLVSSDAKDNWLDAKKGTVEQLSFEEAFTKLKEEWEEDTEMKFPMKREGNDYTVLGFTKSSIKFKKASGGTGHTLSISTLRDYFYENKEVRTTGVGIYYPAILDKLNSYQRSSSIEKEEKNYVLIIDEINRGNVSQIFGELITLIEDDKRLGKPEALEITLPYSKERFGVPPNLFIIGTMNTADRSVEALDTALRRRFSFEEMPPKPKLIKQEGKLENGIWKNIDLELLLNTINKRIEKLIDKDRQIGHSYFMSVANFTDLKSAFQNKIIPLLQEYFFGDYGKIGLVVGDGFVERIESDENIFAAFDDYDTSSLAERSIYRIKDIENMKEEAFEAALNTLLKR